MHSPIRAKERKKCSNESVLAVYAMDWFVNFREGCANGLPWGACFFTIRKCCCWTSPSQRWTTARSPFSRRCCAKATHRAGRLFFRPISCGRRWSSQRTSRLFSEGSLYSKARELRKWPTIRRTSIALTERSERAVSPASVHHCGKGPAQRTAHQRGAEFFVRVLDGDSGAIQFRVRSVLGAVARDFGRTPVAGLLVRERAVAQSRVRARIGKRLSGCASGIACTG